MWAPPGWALATVAYGSTRVALQRWLLYALIDVSLLVSIPGTLSGGARVPAQLLLLLGLLATAGAAAIVALPFVYVYAHVGFVALAVACALYGCRVSPVGGAGSYWQPALGLLVPAGLLLHSATLRLVSCDGTSALSLGDVGAALLFALLGIAQSSWGAALGIRRLKVGVAPSPPLQSGNEDHPLSEPLLGGDGDDKPNPMLAAPASLHDASSLAAVASFAWLNPLFATGKQRQLDLVDLEGLPARDDTSASAAALEAAVVSSHAASHSRNGEQAEGGMASLLAALLIPFGREWAFIGVLQVGCVACALASPLVLQALLSYFEAAVPVDKGAQLGPGSPFVGLGWATLMIAVQAAAALVTAQFLYRSTRLQLRIRGALVPAVQRRVLAAPLGARRATSSGALSNHISVDIDRLLNAVSSIHQFWTLPIQVLIILVELHSAVSWAAGAGLCVLAVLVPLNLIVARRIGDATRVMMTARDERVRATSELFGGMRAVKMGAWEVPLLTRIAAARAREFKALRLRKYLDAVCVWCWACTPLLMALSTFGLLLLLPQGSSPDAFSPARVWSTLAMLNMLIFPLNAFPWVLSGLLEARVSLRRLEAFLLHTTDAKGTPWAQSTLCREESAAPLAPDTLLRVSGAFAFAPGPPPAEAAEEEKGGAEAVSSDAPSPTPNADISAESFVLNLASSPLLPQGVCVSSGELFVVCGSVGAGKSAFISACVGEMMAATTGAFAVAAAAVGAPLEQGCVHASRSCSFSLAPQVPWVRCGSTLRENVILGEDEDQLRLARVLEAVGLTGEAAARGLDAIVTETTLSGGQRQRLGLARALYTRSSLVLLDDPTASLDAHVSRIVWDRAIKGGRRGRGEGFAAFDAGTCSFLAAEGRACVIVTHDARFVPDADRVLVLEHGGPIFCGPPSALTDAMHVSAGLRTPEDAPTQGSSTDPLLSPSATVPVAGAAIGSSTAVSVEGDAPVPPPESVWKEGEDENREAGVIKGTVLRSYASSVGWPLSLIVLITLLAMQASRNGSDLLLSVWSAVMTDAAGTTGPSAALVKWLAARGWGNGDFLRAFSFIAGFNFLVAAVRSVGFAAAGLRACSAIHTRLLSSLVAAPQRFHDATPPGRLVNRISGDQWTIDDSLPFSLNILLAQAVGLLGTVTVLAYSTSGTFLAALPPLLVAFSVLQHTYRATSRELKRLESTTRSSLLSEFTDLRGGESVLLAASLLRPSKLSSAWGTTVGDDAQEGASPPCAADREAATTLRLLDDSQRASFSSGMASQWLALRLQGLGLGMLCAMAFCCVFLRMFADKAAAAAADDGGCTSPLTDAPVGGGAGASGGDGGAAGLAGLALSYALPIVYALQGLVGAVADTEREFIAVERAREYVDLPHECDAIAAACMRALEGKIKGGQKTGGPPTWRPRSASVRFEGVTVSYEAGGARSTSSAPAVDDVMLHVPAGSSLGICGVSGSGKSSLLATLWRVAPLSAGRVLLGGEDTATIPLGELRACLASVPQEPFLVCGPLKLSLDAHSEHSDAALSTALSDVGLGHISPEAHVLEGGRNFSHGERQLVCLARALLAHAPIIGLDEPASAADAGTDARMTAALARARGAATVIVIAHRGASLLACDKVVVMEAGRVVEGPEAPQVLLSRGDSRFAALMEGGQ